MVVGTTTSISEVVVYVTVTGLPLTVCVSVTAQVVVDVEVTSVVMQVVDGGRVTVTSPPQPPMQLVIEMIEVVVVVMTTGLPLTVVVEVRGQTVVVSVTTTVAVVVGPLFQRGARPGARPWATAEAARANRERTAFMMSRFTRRLRESECFLCGLPRGERGY